MSSTNSYLQDSFDLFFFKEYFIGRWNDCKAFNLVAVARNSDWAIDTDTGVFCMLR